VLLILAAFFRISGDANQGIFVLHDEDGRMSISCVGHPEIRCGITPHTLPARDSLPRRFRVFRLDDKPISTFSAGSRRQRTGVPSLSNVQKMALGVSVPLVQRVNLHDCMVPMALAVRQLVRRVNEELATESSDAVRWSNPAWQLRSTRNGGVGCPFGWDSEIHTPARGRPKTTSHAITKKSIAVGRCCQPPRTDSRT